jgi:hypothetical protein
MPGWHASGEQPPEQSDDSAEATTATGWLGAPSAALPLSGLVAPSPAATSQGVSPTHLPNHNPTHNPVPSAPSVSAAPAVPGSAPSRLDQSRQNTPPAVRLPSGPASPGPLAAPSVAAAGLGNNRAARASSAPFSGSATAGGDGPSSSGSGSVSSGSIGSGSIGSGSIGTGSAGGGAFGTRSGRAATRGSGAQPPAGWGERAQPAFPSDWVSATRSDSPQQNTSRRQVEAEPTGDSSSDVAAPSLVRPYARTGGRTKPVRHLDLEALVRTSNNGRDALSSPQLNPEHVNVIHMASGTVSVAEIAARLAVPLGVARVIIADMVDLGLVEVMKTSATQGDERDPAFLRRVLSGLQRL